MPHSLLCGDSHMKKGREKIIISSIVIAMILLTGILIYNYSRENVLLSPAPAISYNCYDNDNNLHTCNAGQYCVNGACVLQAPTTNYQCYDYSF